MVTVRDVPANIFIEKLASYLKASVATVKPPPWTAFTKTSPHKERVPDNPDWWYYRAAAILRKIYLADAPVGLETLRTIFGGLKRRGSAPPHYRKCGGGHLRRILHQLEAAGLIEKTSKGRRITDKGRATLDGLALEVFKELVKSNPQLLKYAPPQITRELSPGSSKSN
ncbi:MAG: 30S ribosomal protein S19e [Ignisphaera sp.]|nr:30S ribosomal protein S19e [Ignisphaera sp.]MCX8168313.1 30S ribosomal protein S19e [Ignisphaera sp.]MDW8085355.1 30S ribosomal protein S19e [Ignisphaera sp.]